MSFNWPGSRFRWHLVTSITCIYIYFSRTYNGPTIVMVAVLPLLSFPFMLSPDADSDQEEMDVSPQRISLSEKFKEGT